LLCPLQLPASRRFPAKLGRPGAQRPLKAASNGKETGGERDCPIADGEGMRRSMLASLYGPYRKASLKHGQARARAQAGHPPAGDAGNPNR